jgi:hypothetical protein
LTYLKILVLGLALANAGYFLWSRDIGRPAAAPVAAPAPTLKLASEAGDPNLRPSTPAVPAPDNTGADAARDAGTTDLLSNVKRCISVGPFRDVSEAAHAAATLRGGGYDPRQRMTDGEVWAGVWVYLPLPATRGADDQMLAKLKAAGITDALEMPGPNDASVISLGLFSDQKRAQARVAQAQALGLNPGMADRKHAGSVYWVDIELKPTDSMLNAADLQGEAGRIVRLEVKGCPGTPGAQ